MTSAFNTDTKISLSTELGNLDGFSLHPHYADLLRETHARTAIGIKAPCVCTHLVFIAGEKGLQSDRDQIHQLAQQKNITIDELEKNHAILKTKNGILKWERHTEFSTFTFLDYDVESGHSKTLNELFPENWEMQINGHLLIAVRIHLDDEDTPIWWQGWEKSPSSDPSGCLSLVNGGKSLVWYNFKPENDGLLHIYVCDKSKNERVCGRVVQRLLDVETYRTLALLAMPEVKQIGPMIAEFDNEIASIAKELSSKNGAGDEILLQRLTDVAAKSEDITVQVQFRLNASIAYARIVRNRLENMREEKIEGYQRLSNFILRRLSPAVSTFESVLERQNAVSVRVSRLSNLLRARIDVELENQNQALLTSMNKRATQQLKLQTTVEGLSVIAISYYLIGILLYFFKPLKEYFEWKNGDEIMIFAVPLTLLFVWWFINRLRNSHK